MKLTTALIVTLMSAHASATTPTTVTLVSRYTGGTYNTAGYSFRKMSQDPELTLNNYEILFEGFDGSKDYFKVNTVVDDNSFIYDLGERNCTDIKSQSNYPKDRVLRPLVWLAYSDASPSNLKPEKTVLVSVGHCYLAYNNDEDGRVISLFHVKSHEKGKSVVIDQIEVLDNIK